MTTDEMTDDMQAVAMERAADRQLMRGIGLLSVLAIVAAAVLLCLPGCKSLPAGAVGAVAGLTNSLPAVDLPGQDKPALCGCDLALPLADGPYDAEHMHINERMEECSIETQTGLLVRYQVWIPSRRDWWMQSSIGKGHVRLDASGNIYAECHTTQGYRYHVTGFGPTELHGNRPPDNKVIGNAVRNGQGRQYINVECRKAQ